MLENDFLQVNHRLRVLGKPADPNVHETMCVPNMSISIDDLFVGRERLLTIGTDII